MTSIDTDPCGSNKEQPLQLTVPGPLGPPGASAVSAVEEGSGRETAIVPLRELAASHV